MVVLHQIEEKQLLILRKLAEVAQSQASSLYLIGGNVRDLVRGVAAADLDIMVEGDLGSFISAIDSRWEELFSNAPKPSSITRYEKFLTAKLFFREKFYDHDQIDFSQARQEIYPAPGLAPVVSPGNLESDIRRRDFTVNSLALKISERGLTLVDLCGGKADLKEEILRVHHPKSFSDDPIRVIRAVRFSARFGFALEPQTKTLFDQAISNKLLSTVPALRKFDELRKVLLERRSDLILKRLSDLKLLEELCPFVEYKPLDSAEGDWIEKLSTLVIKKEDPEWKKFLNFTSVPKVDKKRLTQ